MRLKYTLILVVLVLAFGITSTPGSGRNDAAVELLQTEMGLEASAGLKCSLQSKKSAVRRAGNGRLRVSINSNWVCQ